MKDKKMLSFFCRSRKNELIYEIGVQISAEFDPQRLLHLIVDRIKTALDLSYCAILLKEGNDLIIRAVTEYPEDIIGKKIALGQGISGRCALEKKVINVGDVRLDPDYIRSGIQDIRSEIACPVISEGSLLGVLTVESKNENAFSEDDIRLLSILSLQVAVGMRNARMYAEIEKLAITDPLTGLYNYRYFYQRLGAELARSQRYRHPLSIIMIDLDDFKKINDHCGHLCGDRVLREAALAIRKNIRRYDEPMILKGAEIDIVSRYGGEEFIIIQPDTPWQGALVCAERLRNMLETQIGPRSGLPCIENSPSRVTGSFGVAAFLAGETMESMIKRADTAMYQAKDQGKNRVVAL